MMVELLCGQSVWLIGDPHLGRRFETGVPLDRRGEREARQLAKFKAELATDCDINIQVGDLFDHPQVALSVIVDAADACLDAAKARPKTDFFQMAGNHDRSRQLATIGAWEIFRRLVEGKLPNLFVVDEPGQVETIAFFPWQWGMTAVEQIERRFPEPNVEIELVVGHWDLESFGGNADHLAPTKLLQATFPALQRLTTGHWHLEGEYKVDGVDITCTGSLEPYTHAEDPNGEIYVSLTLEQLADRDPLSLVDKCVRVLLREGEELPVGLDCFALTAKRLTAEEQENVAEKLGAFDWQEILDEHLKDVPDYVRTFIDERLHPA